MPRLNMASMPDLIFTVLFFFMTVTHMRNETPRLSIETPEGKELTQPKNKRTLINLYIGTDKQGNTRVQVGDKVSAAITNSDGIPEGWNMPLFGGMEVGEFSEDVVVNIRADKNVPMGIVSDVKQELRKRGFLNIRYNATESNRPQK